MEKKFHYRDDPKQVPTPDFKFCLLGELGVGKTSFLCTVGLGEFPREYVPTVFEQFTVPIDIPKTNTTKYASIWELPIGSDSERSRAISYPMSDCFIFAFSVDRRDTFEKIFSIWIPEVKRHTEIQRFIIVGLRCDLRLTVDAGQKGAFIPKDEARKLSIEAGAFSYVECSAMNGICVPDVLQAAALSMESSDINQSRNTRCEIQ